MIYGRQLCPQSPASVSAWGSFRGKHKKLSGPQIPEKGAPSGGIKFDKQRLQMPTDLQLGWLRARSFQLMTVLTCPVEPSELSCSNKRAAPLPDLGLTFLSHPLTIVTHHFVSSCMAGPLECSNDRKGYIRHTVCS